MELSQIPHDSTVSLGNEFLHVLEPDELAQLHQQRLCFLSGFPHWSIPLQRDAHDGLDVRVQYHSRYTLQCCLDQVQQSDEGGGCAHLLLSLPDESQKAIQNLRQPFGEQYPKALHEALQRLDGALHQRVLFAVQRSLQQDNECVKPATCRATHDCEFRGRQLTRTV